MADGTGVLAPEASPCTGVCVINSTTGLCEGCCRSMDEIAAWRELPQAKRTEVLQRLRERQQKRFHFEA